MRTRTLFTINNEVVIEEPRELTEVDIEKMKWVIAEECSCEFDDIDYFVETSDDELSDIDVTHNGLMDWKDCQGSILKGVKCTIVIGSDAYLDAINDGTIINYLEFY